MHGNTAKITALLQRETDLFSRHGGRIPEANEELNSLQRDKINAVYECHGKAYIGKKNHYGTERENLTVDSVFTEYTGQMVYNFGADYVVPAEDKELANLVLQWNTGGQTASPSFINKITNRIGELGGVNLVWS